MKSKLEELNELKKRLSKLNIEMEKMKNTSVKEWTDTYKAYDTLETYKTVQESIKNLEEEIKSSETSKRSKTCCNSDHSHEKKLFEMSFEDKEKSIKQLIKLGSTLFDEGRVDLCRSYLQKANVMLSYTFPDTNSDEEYEKHDNLIYLVNFLKARVFLKDGEYSESVNCCEKCLEVKKDCLKVKLIKIRALRLNSGFEEVNNLLKSVKNKVKSKELKEEFELEERVSLHAGQVYSNNLKEISQKMFK